MQQCALVALCAFLQFQGSASLLPLLPVSPVTEASYLQNTKTLAMGIFRKYIFTPPRHLPCLRMASHRRSIHFENTGRRKGTILSANREEGVSGNDLPSPSEDGDGLEALMVDDRGFSSYLSQGVDRLLAYLRDGQLNEEGRQTIRKQVIELEQLQNFPLSRDFFSLAVSGDWELLYSTSRVGVPDPNLKIRAIRSCLDGENRTLVHKAIWEFTEEGDDVNPTRVTNGVFEVSCSYNLSEVASVPTRMIVSVQEHRLTCNPVKRVPRNPQALVGALQRALPREFFDPDEALMDTTYLNPDVRIVCYLGMRFAGVRHIYRRTGVNMMSSEEPEASD